MKRTRELPLDADELIQALQDAHSFARDPKKGRVGRVWSVALGGDGAGNRVRVPATDQAVVPKMGTSSLTQSEF